MLLIGLFALVMMLVPAAAHAGPLIVAAVMGSVFAASATGLIIGFAITTALSMAISFVASALLKPASSGGPTVPGTSTTVIDNKITVRQTTAPRRVIYGEARVGGTYAFIHSTDNNKYLHLVIMFAGHEVEGFTQFWVGDEAFVTYENRAAAAPGAYVIDSGGFVVDGQYANKVRVEFVRGVASQTALGSLVSESGGLWTSNHRLRGIAYAYVRLEYDRVTFAGGIPNITAVIKGKKVYDPRAGASGWTRNPALCIADYLCDTTYGIGIDYSTGIDATALAVAANACDEAVALDAGGAEVRFACNGSFTSNDEPQAVLGRLLGSMHGKAPFDGERWKIMAGVYYTPTLTFTDDDLRAGPRVQTLTSRRDRFNAVKGTYINPANFWQESDFPPVTNSTYATQDASTIWRDAVLPFTISPSMAQRIAKIDLEKGRQEITASMPCKLSAWRCQAGDTIYWTSERYGWTSKAFEVKSARFAVDASNGTLGVDLELSETAASVYDWSTADETTVDDAPNTTLPNPFTVLPASSLAVAEEVYITTAGVGTRSRALVTWAASVDQFVASYQPEWKLGSGAWNIAPRTTDVAATIEDLIPGSYQFRVAAVNELNKLSTYVTLSKTITGTVAVPATPSGLTVTTHTEVGSAVTGILLSWTMSTEEMVKVGGSVEVRYTTGSGGIVWSTATVLLTAPGNAMSAAVPFSTGYYLIKFKSATGIYSSGFDQVAATKTNVDVLSDIAIDAGTVTAGTFTGTTFQTAASGVRSTIDGARTMFRTTDPSYASRPYYRSLGLSEPELVTQIGADSAVGYARVANYQTAGHAIDGISLGDNVTPDNTPNSQAVTGFGDFAGGSFAGTKNGAIFSGGTWAAYAVSGGYGPFTGSHDALILKTTPTEIGDLVRDVAVVAMKDISNTICRVDLTTAANQSGVLGAVAARRPLSIWGAPTALCAIPAEVDDTRSQIADEFVTLIDLYDVVTVNAVGEGQVNACGQGGDLTSGALFVSSDIPGKAMAQADDVVRAGTVGRVRGDVTFSEPGEVKLAACIYGNG